MIHGTRSRLTTLNPFSKLCTQAFLGGFEEVRDGGSTGFRKDGLCRPFDEDPPFVDGRPLDDDLLEEPYCAGDDRP